MHLRDKGGAGGEPAARKLATIQLYPLIDHLADKICARYERHGVQRIASTRYRDLVDLILIALQETLDGRHLHTALHNEVARRRALGTALELPESFRIPDRPRCASGYRAVGANVPELSEFRTIEQATTLASAFLDPVLRNDNPGRWEPTTRTWTHT